MTQYGSELMPIEVDSTVPELVENSSEFFVIFLEYVASVLENTK